MPGQPRFLGVGRITPSVEWFALEHSHPNFNEMIVVLQGRIETRISDQVVVGGVGDVLFYPMGRKHVERSLGPEPLATVFCCWSDGDVDRYRAWPHLFRDPQLRIRTLAFWIEELFSPGFEQNRLHLDLLLSLILMESEGQAVNPQKDLLRHVNTFIQGRMADPLTLEDLAHHVNKSKFHFSRIFKQETGRSPMSYLRDFRVRAAQLLLATTTLPLKAIAQQVGFRDEFHFSRIYKRATGHPPGATRRKSML